MHYVAACPVCKRDESGRAKGFARVATTTDRSVLATCEHAHTFILSVSDPTFALIFERALLRVALGSPRDGVLDAHTALEMYLALIPIRVQWDRDPTIAPNDIRKRLKVALALSERVLGAAFASVAMLGGGGAPKLGYRYGRDTKSGRSPWRVSSTRRRPKIL